MKCRGVLCALTAAGLLSAAQPAVADPLASMSAEVWHGPVSGSFGLASDQAGGVFFDPVDLAGPVEEGADFATANTRGLAQSIFNALGAGDAALSHIGEPVKFAGVFEYRITGFDNRALIEDNPNQVFPFVWSWSIDMYSGPTEDANASASESIAIDTTWNDLDSGWIGDGNGNYVWNAFWSEEAQPRGIFAWASTDGPPAWWGDLNGSFVNPDGFLSYHDAWPNSAFILSDGSFEVAAIPLPAAVWAGIALFGVMGGTQAIRRRRRA